MRRFVNFFLILFLVDGVTSLLDELLFSLSIIAVPSAARSLFAGVVIIAAIPLYGCLCIDKRLPKRILLPQLVLVFWSLFDFWPLPVMVDRIWYSLPMALVQICLGVVPFLYFRLKSGKQFLMAEEMLAGPFFGLRHTLVFVTVNLVLLPFIVVYMVISIASLQLDQKTGGFARLRPDGLHMTEKTYRLDGKEIRLTGMIHIADQDYFDRVIESISSERTIVLAEGVTDKNNRLEHGFSYGRLASNLGLTSQERMVFKGSVIESAEIGASDWDASDGTYHVLRADIDIDEFHPKTVEFLNILGRDILGSSSFSGGLKSYLAWVKENSRHITPQTIFNDILNKRNREVIFHMDSALASYDTIIIPWGALHMPEIEAAVVNRGFSLFKTRQRVSIDFLKILQSR